MIEILFDGTHGIKKLDILYNLYLNGLLYLIWSINDSREGRNCKITELCSHDKLLFVNLKYFT